MSFDRSPLGAASLGAWLSSTQGWVQLGPGWRSCRARWLPNAVCASLSHGSEATSVPARGSSPQGSWDRNMCKSNLLSGVTSLSLQANIWVVAFPKPASWKGHVRNLLQLLGTSISVWKARRCCFFPPYTGTREMRSVNTSAKIILSCLV